MAFIGEDSLADTIGPRLDEAGGDSSRFHVVRSRVTTSEGGELFETSVSIERDIELFREELSNRPDVVAVIFDPISEFMPGVNAHKDNDVRATLSHLARMAEDFNVAVISIGHFNKGNTGPAIYRAMGSVAFTAYARLAWAFIKDHEDDDRVLMLPLKCNIGRKRAGLAYRVVEGNTAGKIEWEENAVETTADEAMAEPQQQETKSKLAEACDWLRTRLASGCVESDQLGAEAKAAGIASKTLWRAREKVGVKCSKGRGKNGDWFVSLPNNIDDQVGKDDQVDQVEVGQVGQLSQGNHVGQDGLF